MKKNLLLLLALSILPVCLVRQTKAVTEISANISQTKITERKLGVTVNKQSIGPKIDFQPHFERLGVEGSIIIYDRNKDIFYQYNPSRNKTPFLPASTFKIFNSLVALETGVIKDELVVLTWDGKKRDLDVWNQDYNMRQAIKYSTVWFDQVLARKIGRERMQEYINKVGYGNKNIGAEEDLDRFWLDGELKITAKEQINFLQRLYRGDLPFSEHSMKIVKDILVVEETPEYTLRAKTGLTDARKLSSDGM
ncbi:MAG: penicillin-binding transpeptidase domain-containing protein [Prochloraceae cyanobacterium]|nr:penicillin-binding transpeptidase domain-containing protein [Prochloraceae cyanobacterium]